MAIPLISEAKAAPNPDIVEILEIALKEAKSGDMQGVVLFSSHRGHWTMSCQAGQSCVSEIIVAFEEWKFRRMWELTRTDSP